MTQADLENFATHLRSTGLNASWQELLGLAENVIGNLVDAYRIAILTTQGSGEIAFPASGANYEILRKKLYAALAALTSPEQVSCWEAEVCAGLHPVNTDDK